MNHVGESEVGRFRVEARAFVAHESVLGWVKLDAVFDAGGAESAFDGVRGLRWGHGGRSHRRS